MAVPNIGSGGGGFQVSPGINITEIDLTTVVPAVSTTTGAIAGVFKWGPVDKLVLIDSENTLAQTFGKPSNLNAETWFSAANFLAYGGALYVSRAANTTVSVLSSVANTGVVASIPAHTVKNSDDYIVKSASFENNVKYIAKYPGLIGNSLRVSVCASATQYSSNITFSNVLSNTSFASPSSVIAMSVGSNTATVTLANTAALGGDTPMVFANNVAALFSVGDIITLGNSSIGVQNLKITAVSGINIANTAGANTGTATFTISTDQLYRLSTNYSANTVTRNWEFYNQVDSAPTQSSYVASFGNTAAQDEMHVVVVDQNGQFTGNPGTVVEVFPHVSRATDSKKSDGGTKYFKNIINNQSSFIWVASDWANAVSNTAFNVTSASGNVPLSLSMGGGTDGAAETAVSFSDIARAYDLYNSAQKVDISLLLSGISVSGTSGQLANYLIDNIAEVRKDCIVFISPESAAVVNNVTGRPAADVVTFRNNVHSSSYAVLDSGYKYQWDKYNDVFRYIPLNGDIAGIAARTDSIADPWFSPAGVNRGQVKNLIKLAFNPTQAERDSLYKNGINPVVTFPGQGTILYGDKTLLSKPSAFDRINVRRLFIVLEKAISLAAQSTMFEFNDEFTRIQFKNLIEPFLRDVQGRRGIYDFRVVCDDTNNTQDVIDTNRFVGDIYIKPAKSINFMTLNFVAVRSGVTFTEVTGSF